MSLYGSIVYLRRYDISSIKKSLTKYLSYSRVDFGIFQEISLIVPKKVFTYTIKFYDS